MGLRFEVQAWAMFFFPRLGSALIWLTSWGFPTISSSKDCKIVIYSIDSFSLGLASLGVAHSPWSPGPRSAGPLVPGHLVPWSWSPGPLVPWSFWVLNGLSILWSLVAVFGRLEILPITVFGASEKIGLQQNNDI